MFAFIKRFFTEERSNSPYITQWLQGKAVNLDSYPGFRMVSEEQALAEATVMACVRVLAESVAQLPFNLYGPNSTGKREIKQMHRAAQVINYPNQIQNDFEFRELIMKNCLLHGNFYGDKRNGVTPLNPVKVRPFCYDSKGRSSFVEMLVDSQIGYQVNTESGTATLLKDEMLHVRGLSINGLAGLSPIGYQAETVGLALDARNHGANFLRNGARPSGIVSHPKTLSATAQQNISEAFDIRFAGVGNAGKTIVLQEGATYTAAQINHRDAQYLESRKFSKQEICAFFRVPPHMVADLDRATFANIEEMGLEFVIFSLGPWLSRIELAYNYSFLTEQERLSGYTFRHNVKGFLRGNNAARSQYYQSGINTGWLTRNEAREMEDLNPIEGADVLLVPQNMAPGGTDDVKGDAK